tara:strand:- start:2048 stop:2860 length:813 start_codon:yes stop_codon:yes gene_type:complete
MVKLKKNKQLEQKVSIVEFGLLVTGILNFDDFHKYTKQDLIYCNNELYLSQFLKATYTKYVPDKANSKNSNGESEILRRFRIFEQQRTNKNDLTEGIFSRLERLSQEQKKAILDLIELIQKQARYSSASFPFSIKNSSSQTDHAKPVFSRNDLSKWLIDSLDLEDTPLADWFKEYKDNHKSIENDSGNFIPDGYIKIDTLPKVLQLMIDVHDKPEYCKTNSNYNEEVVYKELKSKAVKMDIYLDDNARKRKGLANINIEKIITFIQKDDN